MQQFQSEQDRAKGIALFQTILLCAVLEGLALIILRGITGTFLGAAIVSVIWLGPLSCWIGPALYRYLQKASA